MLESDALQTIGGMIPWAITPQRLLLKCDAIANMTISAVWPQLPLWATGAAQPKVVMIPRGLSRRSSCAKEHR